MTGRYHEDTSVEAVGDGRYRATVSERWSYGLAIDGGYLHGIALRALADAVPHPDPVTSTGHFLARAEPGPTDVDVEVLRVGSGHATGTATLCQRGAPVLHVTATFGDLERTSGPTAVSGLPPDVAPLERCVRAPLGGDDVPLEQQLDQRLDPATASWLTGEPTGRAEVGGWFRFADEAPVDAFALPLVVDSFVPAVYNLGYRSWVPTLELTVHVRARPAPGWLRVAVRTRFVTGGYLEEDAEVWDAAGELVAMSRQLAVTRG